MNLVLMFFGILAGVCAWSLLLAGAVTFYDPDKPEIRGWGFPMFLADIVVSLGMFTMLYVIVRNWRRRPEARRLIYIGACCLGIALTLGCIAFNLN